MVARKTESMNITISEVNMNDAGPHENAASLDTEADHHYKEGNIAQALTLQKQSLAIWRDLGCAEREAGSAQQEAMFHFLLKQYPEAIGCYERASVLYAK